jgi:hypothetical protein
MTKRSWQVTVPGYNSFRMGGELKSTSKPGPPKTAWPCTWIALNPAFS